MSLFPAFSSLGKDTNAELATNAASTSKQGKYFVRILHAKAKARIEFQMEMTLGCRIQVSSCHQVQQLKRTWKQWK